MTVLSTGSVLSRLATVTVGLALVVSTASAATARQAPPAPPGGQAPAQGQAPAGAPGQGQPAPAQQPEQPQPPQPSPFKFDTDAGGIIWAIKAEGAADFESVWTVIKQRLIASEKPDLKALGDSLKIYKAAVPPGPDGVTYVFVADPASKTLSYEVSPFLLFQSGLFERAEADELFKKLQGAIVRINPLPLNIVK
jgi:hypothetical protein